MALLPPTGARVLEEASDNPAKDSFADVNRRVDARERQGALNRFGSLSQPPSLAAVEESTGGPPLVPVLGRRSGGSGLTIATVAKGAARRVAQTASKSRAMITPVSAIPVPLIQDRTP
jgi:hypothetical protein